MWTKGKSWGRKRKRIYHKRRLHETVRKYHIERQRKQNLASEKKTTSSHKFRGDGEGDPNTKRQKEKDVRCQTEGNTKKGTCLREGGWVTPTSNNHSTPTFRTRSIINVKKNFVARFKFRFCFYLFFVSNFSFPPFSFLLWTKNDWQKKKKEIKLERKRRNKMLTLQQKIVCPLPIKRR